MASPNNGYVHAQSMAASKWKPEHLNNRRVYTGASEGTMAEATSSRPQVNGILETSLYVERPTRSVEFYRRVFGLEPIDTEVLAANDPCFHCTRPQ